MQTNVMDRTEQLPFQREFSAFSMNLYCGLRLLFFRRSGIEQAVVSVDQAVFLICFYGLTVLTVSYWTTPFPVFDPYGLKQFCVELFATLIIAFVLTKFAHDPGQFTRFVVLVYSVYPFLYVLTYAVMPNLPYSLMMTGYIVYLVWIISLLFFLVWCLLERKKLKALAVVILWTGASYLLTDTTLSFWYEDYEQENSIYNDYYSIDQERIFYNQYSLLTNTFKSIEPGVTGITDLFFVGFGSDASQDVFMKEVGHIRQFMQQHLGTTGRSVALINNHATIDTIPLASSSNLKFTLQHLGKKINREEDVVFLYLTSHGSEHHDLLVDMWPLRLNDLRAEQIKTYLDRAGIRWRIILVSACYSGGFIDPLKDEYSLIMTAAASDKTSFGCSNENEFTYFGEALFSKTKEKPYQFLPHFNQAIAEIGEREHNEGLPSSEPQLFIGAQMKTKLMQLEQAITQYPEDRFTN